MIRPGVRKAYPWLAAYSSLKIRPYERMRSRNKTRLITQPTMAIFENVLILRRASSSSLPISFFAVGVFMLSSLTSNQVLQSK